jgi:hypothetical protein
MNVMKKTTIILTAILFLAGGCANNCANRQTKTTNNELVGTMATPAQEGMVQPDEKHDKTEETNAQSELAGKMATSAQEGIAQPDEKHGKTEETNAQSELAGKVATPAQEGMAQPDVGHDKPKEANAQGDIKDRILSKNEVKQLLTDEIKKTFGIQYPIWRVYAYRDNSGEHRIVLTESAKSRNIKAFFFRLENDVLIKEKEMSDSIQPGEISIQFWTRYCSFSDIDGDGLVEPMIVYGPNLEGASEPYRVNILVYYKGEKYAQRHTDGDLDPMRSTQIDEKFYALPQAIQEHVKNTTNEMIKNKHVVSWEQ